MKQTRLFSFKLLLILPFLVMLACGLPGLAQTPHSETAATGSDSSTLIPAMLPTGTGLTPTQITPVPSHASTSTLAPRITQSQPASATKTTTVMAAAAGPAAIQLVLGSPQPAPAGILAQVGSLQSGGGNGDSGNDCENRSGGIRWCSPLKGGTLPLTASYLGIACGFNNQALTATVELPDGRTQVVAVQGEPPHCREISYAPGPDALLGRYQVTLSQGNIRLTDSFVLAAPSKPAGTLFQNCAWLAGLPPGQSLRLLSFGLVPPNPTDSAIDPSVATWKFEGERKLTPGPTGILLACPDPSGLERYPELVYLAYPADGPPLPLGDADTLNQFQGFCAGGPMARLVRGKNARINVKEIPLFSDPAMNAKLVAILPRGRIVAVVNGPVCPPEGPWTWQVRTSDGVTGWIAESDTTTYFLEPAP